MTFRDCYRLTLHSIKENKARSILTVIISTFLSTLIMGMMALAVSFSKNSDNIINKAYFSDDSIITVNYQNSRVQAVEDQEVFTKKYLESFYKTIDDYSDMVQFIQYETNVLSTFNFVDSKYSQEVGINIIEGRNVEPSEKGNEVIVSKAYYLKSLEDEIPHGIAVEVESMKKREDKELYDIEATIYCEKKSHKGIIIGKDGATLKVIGERAREDIEKMLDCQVNLQLWVKVKEGWRDDETKLNQIFKS